MDVFLEIGTRIYEYTPPPRINALVTPLSSAIDHSRCNK